MLPLFNFYCPSYLQKKKKKNYNCGIHCGVSCDQSANGRVMFSPPNYLSEIEMKLESFKSTIETCGPLPR